MAPCRTAQVCKLFCLEGLLPLFFMRCWFKRNPFSLCEPSPMGLTTFCTLTCCTGRKHPAILDLIVSPSCCDWPSGLDHISGCNTSSSRQDMHIISVQPGWLSFYASMGITDGPRVISVEGTCLPWSGQLRSGFNEGCGRLGRGSAGQTLRTGGVALPQTTVRHQWRQASR